MVASGKREVSVKIRVYDIDIESKRLSVRFFRGSCVVGVPVSPERMKMHRLLQCTVCTTFKDVQNFGLFIWDLASLRPDFAPTWLPVPVAAVR